MSNNTNLSATKTLVNWFEIPVTDMKKSIALYEAMLDLKLS